MKTTGKEFLKTLRYLCLIGVIILGLMSIVGTGGGGGDGGGSSSSSSTPTYDATGTWTYTTSDNWVNAGTADCDPDANETGTVTITQTGDNVTVVIKGKTYTGTVSGATYTGTATYWEDDGDVTTTVKFTLTSIEDGEGTVVWSWTNGSISCNGGSTLSLTKEGSGGETCANFAGTWETEEVVHAEQCGEGVYTEHKTYEATQSGCAITVTDEDGNTYSGSVNGDQISWSGSYPDDGGTTTINSLNLTLSEDGMHFTGSSSWTWTGNSSTCSGTTAVTGTRASGGAEPLNIQAMVVGTWYGEITCGDTTIAAGFFFCPAGRLRGFENIQGHDFINCGTWYVDQNDHVITNYTAKDVEIGDSWEGYFTDFLYKPDTDQLVWNTSCPLTLNRLEGAVDDADCLSSTCTAGGTGDIECGTDMDCGRCWRCDQNNHCIYCGEGPYGCYCGWEPPI